MSDFPRMRKPKYRKNAARDRAFVEWKGKRHYLPGLYNSPVSLEAYREFLATHVYGSVVKQQESRGIAISGLAMAFLDYAEKHYPPGKHSEFENCRYALVPFVKMFGAEPAADFGPKKLKAYRDTLIAAKQSRNYINQQIAKIRRAFRWAVSEELIPATTLYGIASVDGLKAGRSDAKETGKRQPVAWEHIEPILGELSPMVKAMVLLQWYTGCRPGTICQATPSQFREDGDLLLWVPASHKTTHLGRELTIPIGPKCRAAIAVYLKEPPDAPLFCPRVHRKNARYRALYSPRSYRQAVIRAIERVNANQEEKNKLPVWSPHQLRHSKGRSVRAEYGVEGAQAILGHDSLDATQIYSERRLELAKRIARETG